MNASRATPLAFALLILCADADAAQRTFVASTGNDANACSLTAPCRSFAAALTHTDPSGEVIVLDSAGYGPVNIAQSVSIIAPPGTYAGISVFATQSGVAIFGLTPTDRVVLRGLTINSQGGDYGVILSSGGGIVHVEDCVISGFGIAGRAGIHVTNSADAQLFVSDTIVKSGASGIQAMPTSGFIKVVIDRVRLTELSANGVDLGNAFTAQIRDSAIIATAQGIYVGVAPVTGSSINIERTTLSNSSLFAFYANFAGGTTLDVSMTDSIVADNGAGFFMNTVTGSLKGTITRSTFSGNVGFNGAVKANGASTIRLNGNTIVRNAVGWSGAGSVLSLGNNLIEDNGSGNTAPPPMTPK